MTASKPTILIIDDEDMIRNMLGIFLGVEDFEVLESATGKHGLRSAVAGKPDLILLDLGLPDLDGKDIIKSLRQWTHTPIIILSARSEEDQAAACLNLGADDYVCKPFRVEVLLARIRANLRYRDIVAKSSSVVSNGPIRIDRTRHQVTISGNIVPLPPKEFDLLCLFVTNCGRMVTHKQILREVWGPSHVDDNHYLRVYVGQLREKLDKAGFPGVIVVETGIGYRMDVLAVPAMLPAA